MLMTYLKGIKLLTLKSKILVEMRLHNKLSRMQGRPSWEADFEIIGWNNNKRRERADHFEAKNL